ncbi:MAG: hypothetical protein CV089_02135 [Nitrospira sp. WS110]|nr:hypothetical protein [Nitrospira sp. WS110]
MGHGPGKWNTEYTKTFEKPNRPLVTFYLAANQQYKKGERINVSIGGHNYHLTVGTKNTAPLEVYEEVRNSKSMCRVPNNEQTSPFEGGVPRDPHKTDIPLKDHYIGDFDVEVIEMHKQ